MKIKTLLCVDVLLVIIAMGFRKQFSNNAFLGVYLLYLLGFCGLDLFLLENVTSMFGISQEITENVIVYTVISLFGLTVLQTLLIFFKMIRDTYRDCCIQNQISP